MSIRKSIGLFIFFLLLFTLARTPVGFVSKFITLPKGVAYQGLEGTIWQGEITQVQINKTHLSNVKWQFEPFKLFTGNLAFNVSFGNARQAESISGRGLVSMGLSGKRVQDAIVRVAANAAKPMLPIPMGDIEGRVILNVKDYQLGEPLCQITQGDIGWHRAGIDVGGPIEFGTIEADLTCDKGSLVANFDGQNTLGLEGQAKIAAANKFNFTGFMKPSADLPAVVHQGIGMMAKMDSQGRYKISL